MLAPNVSSAYLKAPSTKMSKTTEMSESTRLLRAAERLGPLSMLEEEAVRKSTNMTVPIDFHDVKGCKITSNGFNATKLLTTSKLRGPPLSGQTSLKALP